MCEEGACCSGRSGPPPRWCLPGTEPTPPCHPTPNVLGLSWEGGAGEREGCLAPLTLL